MMSHLILVKKPICGSQLSTRNIKSDKETPEKSKSKGSCIDQNPEDKKSRAIKVLMKTINHKRKCRRC